MRARRGDVAAEQRARLIAATLEACAQHGWEATTVEELVGLAGVSKTSFYELFANREECFLAAFEAVVEAAGGRIGGVYRSRRGLTERMRAGMDAFGEIVAEWPGAAHLVVIDSLSLGAAAVPARAGAAARFERMLRQSFAEAGGPGLDELTARVLVGGVRRIVYRSLRAGRPEAIREHARDLVGWTMTYAEAGATPGGEERAWSAAGDAGTETWAEDPPAAAPARRRLSQRERIVRATAIVATARGYGQATVGEICTVAGVSKESFYEHFDGKPAAFLTAYDALAERALAQAAEAFAGEREWEAGIAAGLGALLAHTAADPLYARLSFFELPAAGPVALDRADTALEAFTAFLNPEAFGAPTPRRPPPVVVEAIGGGVWAAIQHEIAGGRGELLPTLAPRLTAIALTPFAPAQAASTSPGSAEAATGCSCRSGRPE